jgi:Co/Zn/Cd efflux system component
MPEEHHHHPAPASQPIASTERLGLYVKAWLLTFYIAGIELAGSVASGSFALLADVTHVFTDTIVGLGPVSVELGKRRLSIDPRLIERIGGFAVAGILLFVGAHIIEEAGARASGEHAHEVEGLLMFAFAVMAALGNYVQHRLLSRISPMHRHAAHSGFHFHVLTDLLKNLLLPILALAIHFGAPEALDAYAALGIGWLILIRAGLLGLESAVGERLVQRLLHRFVHWIVR